MSKITIIVEDSSMSKNGHGLGNLDFSSCNIPSNVWAFQWNENSGHIEFNSDIPNETVTELPAWVLACESVFDNYVAPSVPTPVTESFWNDYPEANAASVNKILLKDYAGILNEKAVDNNNVLKGILTTKVSEGAAALSSLAKCKDDCVALGVPLMSNIMDDDVNQNFVDYMTITLGYQKNEQNRLYLAWQGDLVTNKAKQDINIARDNTIKQGYTDSNGNVWQIDEISISHMTNKIDSCRKDDGRVDNGILVTWRTMDNQDITMSAGELNTIMKNCVAYIDNLYQQSWADKENIV